MILLALGLGVAVVVALAFAGGDRLRPAPAKLLLVLYLAPALFLALLAWLAPSDAHRLRYALLGVGFRGEPEVPLAVELGGDRTAHPIWIAGFARGDADEPPPAAGEVRFDPRLAGARAEEAERAEPATDAPPAGDEGGTSSDGGGEGAEGDEGDATGTPAAEPVAPAAPLMVAPGPGGGGLLATVVEGRARPVVALELAEGDRLTAAGETWVVERSRYPWRPPATLVAEGSGRRLELPRQKRELPLLGWEVSVLRVYPASQQTYPLPGGGDLARGAPFLFFEPVGLTGGRLFVVAAPGSLAIDRPGGDSPRVRPVALEPEGRLYALSPPRPGRPSDDDEEAWAGGWRDRRSGRVVPGERSVAFLYDTPEVHSLGPADLDLLDARGFAAAPEDGARRVALAMGTWQVVERSLHFRHASDAVAGEALANLELPETLLARWRVWSGGLSAATPRGVVAGRFGEPLWLGDEHLAAVQVDVLRPPLFLALLGLALAFAKAAAAQAVRLPVAAAAVAAALEGLVALRLAIGYRTWAAEPYRPEAMELALVAWALVPWAFLVASAPTDDGDERAWRRWLLPAAGLAFSLAWCVRLGGDGLRAWVWIACHALALALPLARFGHERWGHTTAGWRRRLAGWARARWWRDRPALGWSLVALAFLVVRGGLFFLGFRESLQLGQRFALSLVHVPAAVLVQAGYLAWLWRRGEARGQLEAADLAPALAVVACVWALPALLVSDLGLALLGLPVFLLALVAVLWGLRRRDVRLAPAASSRREPDARGWRAARVRIAPWARRAVVAGLVAVVAGYALVIVSPLGARGMVAAIPDGWRLELESERNFLRFLGYAYPDELARVGRRSSEELAIMAAVMSSYTGGPLGGRGWFGSEWSPHIASTALREHVPSAYVAGAWGLAGTLGLVALYLALAAGGAAPAPWRPGGAEEALFAGLAATLAAWTLAIGGLYMVAANYRLTMFTGKNAYLLGIDSTADVLESLFLALVAAAGLAFVRDREGVR